MAVDARLFAQSDDHPEISKRLIEPDTDLYSSHADQRGDIVSIPDPHDASTPQRRRGWSLQDAKAKFSEVVRLARETGPQRVTLHGRDAVVVVSAETWDRERRQRTGRRLVEVLAASPIQDIVIERPDVAGPVRDVEL